MPANRLIPLRLLQPSSEMRLSNSDNRCDQPPRPSIILIQLHSTCFLLLIQCLLDPSIYLHISDYVIISHYKYLQVLFCYPLYYLGGIMPRVYPQKDLLSVCSDALPFETHRITFVPALRTVPYLVSIASVRCTLVAQCTHHAPIPTLYPSVQPLVNSSVMHFGLKTAPQSISPTNYTVPEPRS